MTIHWAPSLRSRRSTVVPNQSVTVTGRGFSDSAFLRKGVIDSTAGGKTGDTSRQILIGGTKIDWDNVDDGDEVDIDSGGNWVATVVVPVNFSCYRSPGEYELRAVDSDGRPGVTEITISPRTVDFEPKESRAGTNVVVSGTGWPAVNSARGLQLQSVGGIYPGRWVESGDFSQRATPDSNGSFSTTIKVPLNANIPSTNKVTVSYEDAATSDKLKLPRPRAHRVPGAEDRP